MAHPFKKTSACAVRSLVILRPREKVTHNRQDGRGHLHRSRADQRDVDLFGDDALIGCDGKSSVHLRASFLAAQTLGNKR